MTRTRLGASVAGGLTAAVLFAGWFAVRPAVHAISALALPSLVLFATAVVVLLLERREARERERRLVELSATLRHKEVELQRLASTDAQTGLLNRRAFYERLATEFRCAIHYGRPLTLLILDLDFFKRVNDTYGHATGDFVLAEFADILRANLRETDVSARYGGEEFVVLLPETDEAAALRVADRIRLRTRDRVFAIGDKSLRMTVSQGLAALPNPDLTTEDMLVNAADTALYGAKHGGRDRVSVVTRRADEKSA